MKVSRPTPGWPISRPCCTRVQELHEKSGPNGSSVHTEGIRQAKAPIYVLPWNSQLAVPKSKTRYRRPFRPSTEWAELNWGWGGSPLSTEVVP